MTKQMVKIGRREVEYDVLIKAVRDNKTYKGILDTLGFNSTVATTMSAIQEVVEELALDTTHMHKKYTKTEGGMNQNFVKDFKLSEINSNYYESFKNYIKQSSWSQYKSTIGNYLESLEDVDFATLTSKDIENYINSKESASEQTKNNCTAHLRSLMIFIVKNNIENAFDKVSKEMMLWLI